MTPVRADPAELRWRMVDELATNDYVIPHWQAFLPWRSAFLAVPRHALIPDMVWVQNGAGLVPLHRTDDPRRWLDLTYADDSVITQVDDGHPAGPGLVGEAPSSSASCPSIVAVMLAALDAQEGQRVLEIGTGTGYNAALLAHRLEAEQVTTMEIDPQVAAQASRALSDIGFGAVTVVTGDGELGYPPAAPYDRVICTAACENIPYPWVAQTKPGGLVLIPWENSYFDGGLVALHVNDDGTAAGTMIGPSSFMWLRQQRARHPGASPIRTADGWDHATVSTTTLHPHDIAGDYDAQFTISQRVPKCRWRYPPYDQDEQEGILWLLDYWSGSWASLTYATPNASDDEFEVRQFGPRQLWDEAETAHRWWIEHGSPPVDQWRFTVTPEGQRIDLT
ncbi:MAG: methyltransferase domain-containing protein [Pseudonocardiaceae bacterium]